MKKILRTVIAAGLFAFMFAAPVLSLISPLTPSASAADCDGRFLGIPPWYRGLTEGSECTIKAPESTEDGLSKFIWKIVLNGVEMALVIVVYIASFFILFGGFQYMTGGGNAGMIEKARKTILNAVIGLIIALGSVAIVNLLFSGIFGDTDGTTVNGVNGIIDLTGQELLANILNLTYFIAGVVAVIVIIISGLSYATSSGDSGKLARAKNLITYSIVGIIIVLVAFTITGFVTGRFSS